MSCIIKTTKSQNNLDQKGSLPSPMPPENRFLGAFSSQVWALFKDRDCSSSLGTCSNVLPPLWWKIFFLISDWHFPQSDLHLLSLFLSLYTFEEGLALSSLHRPIRWVVRVIRSSLSFLFCRLNNVSPCTSCAPVPDHLACPPLDPLQYLSVLILLHTYYICIHI